VKFYIPLLFIIILCVFGYKKESRRVYVFTGLYKISATVKMRRYKYWFGIQPKGTIYDADFNALQWKYEK